MTQKPAQRRGLGRGLGSLIPTGPAREHPAAPPTDPGAGAAGTSSGAAPSVTDPGAPAGDQAGSPAGSSTEVRPDSRPGGQPGDQSSGQTGDQVGAQDSDQAGDGSGGGPDSPPGLKPVHGAYFAELPVEQIGPNPRQPRQVFDEEEMAELVHSIREIGLLQPVVVRRVLEDRDGHGEDRYELIMGERRWRATEKAGLETIPAIVRDTDDDAMLRDALLENLHRSQLNPLEEAAAYQQLLDDFGCTHEELASRIGRSRPQITNTLRLLRLSPAVQRRVAAGVLSAGHARALLAVEDPDIQDRLAGRVVAEGISVRSLEEIVAVGDLAPGRRNGPTRKKPTAPALADLAARLSDRLETRVKVDLGKRKGKITVEFASIPDLERIVGLLDPRQSEA